MSAPSEPAQAGPRQILVVEDDPNYARALDLVLSRAGYQVQSTHTGRSAASLIGLHPYDLVLSDVQLPELSGIQLLHLVKRLRSEVPVVLMTSFTTETPAEEAISLGAAGYLEKPFKAQNLLDLVQKVLEPEPLAKEGESESGILSDFCQISIDEFISGRTASLDLYVRLGEEGRFVKIARAGEELSPERLNTYRRRKLEYFFVSRADYERYIAMQLRLVQAVRSRQGKSDEVPVEKRRTLLKHATEIILQQLFLQGMDQQTFTHARNITEANLAILSSSGEAFGLLDTLNQSSEHLFAHALGVSVYSSMLARAIGWGSPSTLYKISMGGLLHDIGLKSIPRATLDKPLRAYTLDETRALQRHTIQGVDMLKGLDGLPTEVLLIVSQHHEARNGGGYPAGLRDSQIFPLARLVSVVDEFCDLTLKGPGVAPRAPLEAVRFLREIKGPLLDTKLVTKLGELFGAPPGPEPRGLTMTSDAPKKGSPSHGTKGRPHRGQ